MSSVHKINIEELDVQRNIYWQSNHQMFNRLASIINTSGSYIRSIKCIGAQGHSQDNRDLLNWISNMTNFLDGSYTLKTRCYWILHGIAEFPKCWNYNECRHTLEHQNVKDIWTGYNTCCCSKACSNKLRVIHARRRLYELYGVVNVFQLDSVKKKCEDSHMRNLGVKNPSQSKAVKQQKVETCLKNHGVEHPLQSEEIKQRFVKTCLEEFGYEYPGQSKAVQRHIIETNQKRRGVDYVFQDEAVKKQISEKILSLYGVDCILKSPAVIEKTHDFYRKNYGVESGMQVPEIRRKAQLRYAYDNRAFDSKPEIAYYVWLTDNGIRFEYQPDDSIRYWFEGKERLYFPDFKIYDRGGGFRYAELKGDHFLAEDGTWRNPFRDPEWSDEDYAKECAKYEAKRQCCIANNVIIMYSADYQKYLDYVGEKYGRGWLDQFRRDAKSKQSPGTKRQV